MLKKFIEKVIKNKEIDDIDQDGLQAEMDNLGIDDFTLYDELDKYGISDDDDEYFHQIDNADTISYASTPRPNIKPFFDSTSQCSFQHQQSNNSGKSMKSALDPLPSVDEEKRAAPSIEPESTDNDLHTESTAFDTTEPDTDPNRSELEFSNSRKIPLSGSGRKNSKKLKKNVQKSFESDENCLTSESCSLLSESVDPAALIVFAIRGLRNGSVIDSIVSFTGKHEKIHIFDLSKGKLVTLECE